MSEIEPALTAEDEIFKIGSGLEVSPPLGAYSMTPVEEDGTPVGKPRPVTIIPHERRHEVAAKCLHKQEFGFSWEMYDGLMLLTGQHPPEFAARLEAECQTPPEAEELLERLLEEGQKALANIAALLPPREDP